MKLLFKRKITLTEYDILVKQIYNNIIIYVNKSSNILQYGQLFNKFLNIKTHIATTLIYNDIIDDFNKKYQ